MSAGFTWEEVRLPHCPTSHCCCRCPSSVARQLLLVVPLVLDLRGQDFHRLPPGQVPVASGSVTPPIAAVSITQSVQLFVFRSYCRPVSALSLLIDCWTALYWSSVILYSCFTFQEWFESSFTTPVVVVLISGITVSFGWKPALVSVLGRVYRWCGHYRYGRTIRPSHRLICRNRNYDGCPN